jgi:hypothetical protein
MPQLPPQPPSALSPVRPPVASARSGTRASWVAAIFAMTVITLGFTVQALRRGYGFPHYLWQWDYALSLAAATALSVGAMWPWRHRLGWFQVPMAPALAYTFLALLAQAVGGRGG